MRAEGGSPQNRSPAQARFGGALAGGVPIAPYLQWTSQAHLEMCRQSLLLTSKTVPADSCMESDRNFQLFGEGPQSHCWQPRNTHQSLNSSSPNLMHQHVAIVFSA